MLPKGRVILFEFEACGRIGLIFRRRVIMRTLRALYPDRCTNVPLFFSHNVLRLSAVIDVRQQGHIPGLFNGFGEFALIDLRGACEPRRSDTTVLTDEATEHGDILKVNVSDLILLEITLLLTVGEALPKARIVLRVTLFLHVIHF